MTYTFHDIINRVAHNIGVRVPTSYDEESIKASIYDAMVETFERSEALKEFKTLAVCLDLTPEAPAVVKVPKEVTGMTGTFSYKYSYIAESGGESLPSPAASITVADEDVEIDLGITELPYGISAIRIYRNNQKIVDLTTTFIYTDRNTTAVATVTPKSTSTIEDPYQLNLNWNSFKTVQFLTSDDRVLPATEITEEEFMRWNPQYSLQEAESFKIFFDNPEAYISSLTEENIKLDGLIGYTVLDRGKSQFDWKPKFNGKIKFLQVSIPDEDFNNLGDTPDMNKAYVLVLVYDATYREILKRLAEAQSEVDVVKWTKLMEVYEAKRKQRASNYAGHINREIEPAVIKPFSVLNDPSMEI